MTGVAVDRSGVGVALEDDVFRSSCRAAFRAEVAVAIHCVQAGAVEVQVPSYRITPSFDERRVYRDTGDLYVRWAHDGKRCRYEVKKHPHENFSCVAEVPWPLVIVDETANLDAKDPRPDGYFICNATLTAALFINLHRHTLETTTFFDTRYGVRKSFYVLPRGMTRCIPLTWKQE